MNIILGIETSTDILSISILRDKECLALYSAHSQSSHCERIVPLIEDILEAANLKYKDITGVAVSAGPGSFTGLRIGVNTAKTLAHYLGIPLAGVGSLMGIAARALETKSVCPIIDARRERVYCAVYQSGIPEPEEILAPSVMTIEELKDNLQSSTESVVFSGHALTNLRSSIEKHFGEEACFVREKYAEPSAESIARIGLERIKKGFTENALTYEPFYLQTFKAVRKKIPSPLKNNYNYL